MSERRTILAVAATYVAFLLTAQYGFLDQVKAATGGDAAAVRGVLAWMAVAGLAASAAAALAGARLAADRAVRIGLAATALAAALSPMAGSPGTLRVVAAAIGGALGWTTVSLAGGLAALVPAARLGRVAGWGTGLAYLVSNLPPFFASSPGRRAAVSAALCAAAALLAPRARVEEGGEERGGRFAPLLLALAALVLVDSAFFATLQGDPARLALTWGAPALSLRQGAAHFAAALAAGALVDRGLGGAVIAAVAAIFALAMPAIAAPNATGVLVPALGAIGYALGIGAYSAVLVAAPARAGGGRKRAVARAALLFAVAGWIASAAGVGAAEDGALLAAARVGALLFAAAGVVAIAHRFDLRRAAAPAAIAGGAVALAFALDAASAPTAPASPAALGREVYLAEGCQYCHSQYVRAGTFDERWWGPARPFDRTERPPTPGNRRVGPDLTNVGLRRSATWNELHLRDPRSVSPGSRMPSYARLFDDGRGAALVAYLGSLGAASARERDAELVSYQVKTPESGSAARGAALFARHCAVCHGAAGRGDGAAAASFRRPAMDLTAGELPLLGSATDPEARRAAMARAIRFGIAPFLMPGHEWLSDGEVADLVAFVETLGRGAAR